MGIKLSEDSIVQLKAQSLTDDHIADIEENAVSQDTAGLVAEDAYALRSENFVSARIVDFACSAAPTAVVAKVIHDTGKFKRAGLDNNQITAIAMYASTENEVSYMLDLAQKAKEGGTKETRDFEKALELLPPEKQQEEPSLAGSSKSQTEERKART